MAPPRDPKHKNKFLSNTNANSLNAAIFHTMAFKVSLEINNYTITATTKRPNLKVWYNNCKFKKNKQKTVFSHSYGQSKIAICDTVSEPIIVLNSSFTTKDTYFRTAIQQSCTAFNSILLIFAIPKIRRYMIRKSLEFFLRNNIRDTTFQNLIPLHPSTQNLSSFHIL